MASFFISEVGLKPFPRIYVRPKAQLVSRNTSNPKFLRTSNNFSDLKPTNLIEFSTVLFEDNKWGLKVSTPLKVASIEQYEEKDERITGINTFEEHEEEKDERINDINTFEEQEEEARFDSGAPPPFKLADIRAAIPQLCWVKDTWKSMSYVLRDFAFIFIFAAASSYLNNWLVWPLFWAAQGTMFWGLFVLGHDCGHGSFSSNPKLNSIVGHLLHSPLLVPYNGWRISHRLHHQNQGHVENDESWHPISETVYRNLDSITQTWRYKLPFPMFVYPFYLWKRSPGKTGSHFHPNSDLFVPNDRNDVITSTLCCMAMVAVLVGLGLKMGPMMLLKLYGVPYWIFIAWLDFVTYMHHHGHQDRLPWYRGMEWSYFRGGLTTVDHDYGWFNNIHHDIGTHVIHHLFPQIPHYHLVEATEAAKPVLGKYYRDPEQSGPLPFHLIEGFIRSMKKDHYVSDTGDIVYYQTDPDLYKSA